MAEDIRPEGAIRAAKRWLTEVYADEPIEQIGREGVRWQDGHWEITLGFTRPEIDSQAVAPALAELYQRTRRVYKVLVLAGNDNHVIEMRDREVA